MNLIYKTPILKFKVPRARVPMINALVSTMLNDMRRLAPVDTGMLQKSIIAKMKVKSI